MAAGEEKEAGGRRRSSALRTLARLLAFHRPRAWRLGATAVLSLAMVACHVAQPRLLGHVIDQLAGKRGPVPGAGGIAALAGIFLALVGLRALFGFLYVRNLVGIAQRTIADMRQRLYEKVMRLSFEELGRRPTGDIVTRATRDMDKIYRAIGYGFFAWIEGVATIAFALAALAWIDLRLAGTAIAPVPIYIAVIAFVAPAMRRRFREADDRYDRVTSALVGAVTGIRVVKAFGREEDEIRRFRDRVEAFQEGVLETVAYFTNALPAAGLIFRLNLPLTLAVGGWLAIREYVTVGALAAAVLYVRTIGERLRQFRRLIEIAQGGATSGDRLLEFLSLPETVRSPASPRSLPAGGRGEIAFENVSFGFDGSDGPTLRGIGLRIRPGSRVAVVGPTGSGKSVLVSLLYRAYDPTEGAVRLDGVDLRDLSLEALRRSVGVVFQEAFLFSDTVRVNIGLARPDASIDQIRAAARVAQADGFIASLEDGYDTVVGERGVDLSGGEKQRIALARAVLAEPRVLVLDDVSAALDAETEAELRGALDGVARGRTTIVVASRLAAVRRADRIVVLDAGRVVDQGRHEDLVGRCPLYRELFGAELEAGVDGGAAGTPDGGGGRPAPISGTAREGDGS